MAIFKNNTNITGTLRLEFTSGSEVGSIWFDPFEQAVKYKKVCRVPQAWSTGDNLAVGRAYHTGMGSCTTALIAGGYVAPIVLGFTEAFDGATWSSCNQLNLARQYLSGAGDSLAGLVFGGATPTTTGSTESFDGTSWSHETPLSSPRYRGGSAGTQDAALMFGGSPSEQFTEAYDGSSWSTEENLLDCVNGNSGTGTQNAALSHGGNSYGYCSTTTFEYNGNSWSATATTTYTNSSGTNTSKMSGTSNAALTTFWTGTFEFDGYAWSTGTDLNTCRVYHGQAGASSALVAGGNPNLQTTELYPEPCLCIYDETIL